MPKPSQNLLLSIGLGTAIACGSDPIPEAQRSAEANEAPGAPAADPELDAARARLLASRVTDADFAARLTSLLPDPLRLATARSAWMRPQLQTWEAVARSFARACRGT